MRKVDYKRVTDKNRDKDLKSEFCRFCKYFNSNPCCGQQCNKEVDYCDTYKRFIEIYDRLADLEGKIENGTLVELGYHIRKSYKNHDDQRYKIILIDEVEIDKIGYDGLTKEKAEALLKELQEEQE